MMNRVGFYFLGLCIVLSCSNAVFALEFNPGKYEITYEVEMPEMPGMPAGSIPPQTIIQCVTADDPIPKNEEMNQGCQIKNMKKTSNTVSWEMECNRQGQKMTSKGNMTYNGDRFNGSFTTQMGSQTGNMTITSKMKGKRIGDCQDSQ